MDLVASPETRHRTTGYLLALLGFAVATIALIVSLLAESNLPQDPSSSLRLSFGVTGLGFSLVKLGIAAVLAGILIQVHHRVEATARALPHLKRDPVAQTLAARGAETSDGVPEPLPIHKMARRLWKPMLAMGAMVVAAGFVMAIMWSNASNFADQRNAGAWAQGLLFLGEAFILAGISFLLGSILGALREGGGEVQEALGLRVQTLSMPGTAKAFIGLMMLGVMIGVAQFVLYLWTTGISDPQTVDAWWSWLGPFRELSIGLLLSGIVLALATIAQALDFQFKRLTQIVGGGSP